MSGLDLQALRQQMPSTFDRTQNPLGTASALADMQKNYNTLLPPSEQLSVPVGRPRNSPDRIAERELRLKSRLLDRALSPFTQSDMRNQGLSQPQQMARGSVFGAMQPAMPAVPVSPVFNQNPLFTIYR